MARLAKAEKRAPRPIPGIEGAYAKPLTFGQLNEMEAIGELKGKEGENVLLELMLWQGRNLLCDENGESFEDFSSREEIEKLDFGFIQEVQGAIGDFLASGIRTRGT